MVAKILAVALLPLSVACWKENGGTLTTTVSTPVYESPTPAFYNSPNKVVAEIPPDKTLPVSDLHYGKDYLMLEVELEDGKVGYIDVSDVVWSIKPE